MRYRRSDNMCPFTRVLKPSGSDWAATELNWLEVSFKADLPLAKVFTAARPLVAGSPVDEYLKVTLDLPWDQIKDPAGNFSYLNVYGALRHLQTRAIEDVVVGETPRIASSSQTDSQEAAMSPRSDTYENSLRLDDEPRENQVRSAYEADDASDEGGDAMEISDEEGSEEHQEYSLPTGRPTRAATSTADYTRRTVRSSDGIQPISPSTDRRSDRSFQPPASRFESNVQLAAHIFLSHLADGFKIMEPRLNVEMGTSPRFVVQVGEATMTAESDNRLCFLQNGVKIHRKTLALVIECKRKIHNKKAPEILAQEVSGMLALAQQFKDRKAKEVYKVYLISWHHLQPYLSCLEVSDDYLVWLEDRTDPPPNHQKVKRSGTFNLKNPNKRLQFAKIVVEVALDILADDDMNKPLAKRLLRGEPHVPRVPA